ncbi:MAG: hypothetical protein LBT09_03935 [Planctomycetaceae bacterium]|jgi:hypothetical protein|nr:hypothetical protein [Planctomycetaceae bacterium]
MKKLLTLTFVVVLGLFTVGCDDSTSSSSTSTATDKDSTLEVVSYTTAWTNNGNSYSSYYYNDVRYSVTAVPFEGIAYEKASSDFNGPLSTTADVNYIGTANVQSEPYLTHWQDGTSTYSSKPFDGVTYRSRTVYNNDGDSYYNSYDYGYVLYEGTASDDSSRSDYELDGDVYVNKNLIDNDGRVTRIDGND